MQLEEVGNKNLVIKDVKDKGSKVILTFNDDSKVKISKLTYNNFALSEEKEITLHPSPREHDVLLSVGEQISIAKLVMCLENLGYNAISFCGWQIPIITDNKHGDCNIKKINSFISSSGGVFGLSRPLLLASISLIL